MGEMAYVTLFEELDALVEKVDYLNKLIDQKTLQIDNSAILAQMKNTEKVLAELNTEVAFLNKKTEIQQRFWMAIAVIIALSLLLIAIAMLKKSL